jgi:cob(I)alamin adenosyltransferase
MVYLSRIYTKTGDHGDTGLGDGRRVPKDHPRVTAYGSVDELNAILGIFLIHLRDAQAEPAMVDLVRSVQNDLFDVGADLCLPASDGEIPGQVLRVRAEQAVRLEKVIDGWNERLQPLKSFILPGGAAAAAWCHVARTICRRAERDVVTLSHHEKINPQVIVYLNRLSDLLFVLGRVCNNDGKNDVLWVPGETQAKG